MFTAALAFTGCSDDDDEGGAPKADNSYITTEDGDKLLLTGNGVQSFEYNTEGILTAFGCYSDYKISFDPCKITYDNDRELTFSLNGAGFINKMSESYSYQEKDYSAKGYSEASYSYDGSGHLTKFVTNETYSGIDYGEEFNESATSTTILTWANGNLVKAVTNYELNEDGEMFSATDTYTISYGNDAVKNPLGQFTQSLSRVYDDMIDDNYIAELCFVGLFGKPSDYFPTIIEWQSTNSDGYNDQRKYAATYYFNNNGTLASENFYGTNYYYSYSNAPVVNQSEAKVAPFTAPQKRAKRHGFFRSHRNR